MNFRNLVSMAFSNAGIDERHYGVTIIKERSLIYLTIRRANRIMIVDLGVSDEFVTDIVVMDNTLFDDETYLRFMETIEGEEYIYI